MNISIIQLTFNKSLSESDALVVTPKKREHAWNKIQRREGGEGSSYILLWGRAQLLAIPARSWQIERVTVMMAGNNKEPAFPPICPHVSPSDPSPLLPYIIFTIWESNRTQTCGNKNP